MLSKIGTFLLYVFGTLAAAADLYLLGTWGW